MNAPASLGVVFARALAAKDFSRLLDLMHPEIDFRGMTPRRNWEAGDPEAVISTVLGHWFEESDEILALECLESDAFADRERVGYRVSVRNPDGRFLVEQQAYLSARDGRIGWMRVLCSGFRARRIGPLSTDDVDGRGGWSPGRGRPRAVAVRGARDRGRLDQRSTLGQ